MKLRETQRNSLELNEALWSSVKLSGIQMWLPRFQRSSVRLSEAQNNSLSLSETQRIGLSVKLSEAQ